MIAEVGIRRQSAGRYDVVVSHATMKPEIRTATIADVRGRIESLLAAHWQEVAKHKTAAPLRPHWDVYIQAERLNRLIVVIAEVGEKLVGYNAYLLNPLLHNYPHIIASNDVIYLDPEYRRGTLAARMIATGETEARRLGASIVAMHVKPSHDFSNMLTRLGYSEFETIYTKEVV